MVKNLRRQGIGDEQVLVLPVGQRSQELLLIQKDMGGSVQHREVVPVKFVPMTGQVQNGRKLHS
jgi:protein-L-isoaspartate O-methyltransferase